MEIEAKFSIPNATVLAQLNALQQLAGFTVLPGKNKHLRDCYLDTPRRRIFKNGYVLRRRRQADGDWVISLKALGGAEGAIHRREEVETKLVPQLEQKAPNVWHESDVYAKLQTMLGKASLDILFCLTQTRTVHRLADAERVVAELSLDEVHVPVHNAEVIFYEVEVELKKQGTEDDLQAVVAFLKELYFLQPETRSKYERALELIDTPATKNIILSDAERHVLRRITEIDTGTDTYSRRAQALLAIDEGISGAKAAAQSDLSERQVRHWRSGFKKEGVSIFPERVLDKAMHRELPPPPIINSTDATGNAARKLLWHTVREFRQAEPGARLMFRHSLLDTMLLVTRKLSVGIRDFEAFSSQTMPAEFLAPLNTLSTLTINARNTLALLNRTEGFFAKSKSLSGDNFLQKGRKRFAEHRAALRAFLDEDIFAEFQNNLDTLLQLPSAWNSTTHSPIRLVVPIMLYLRLADILSQPVDVAVPRNLPETLNSTGEFIATLNMISTVMEKDYFRLSKPMLQFYSDLQEYFELSHAEKTLNTYLKTGLWEELDDTSEPAKQPEDTSAVLACLATISAERANARIALATSWQSIIHEKYWQKVGNAVKRL